MAKRVRIQHYHSMSATTIDDITKLVDGEIAVLGKKDNEKLIIKNSNNESATFSSDAAVKEWDKAVLESAITYTSDSVGTINEEIANLGQHIVETYVPKVGDTTIEGDLVIKGSIISTKGFYEDPNGGETDIEMIEYATTEYVKNQISSIDNKLENLDADINASSGYYITGIKQENGKITGIETEKLPDAGELGTLTAVTVTAGSGLTDGGTITGSSGTITINVGAGTGITVNENSVSISEEYQNKIDSGVSAYNKVVGFLEGVEVSGSVVDTLVEIQNYINTDSGATAELLTNVGKAQETADDALEIANTYNGTLTAVTVTAGSGLTNGGTISGTTGSTGGTITIAHEDTSSVDTSKTFGGVSNVTGTNGATLTVPNFKVDGFGHVVSAGTITYTSVNTDYSGTTEDLHYEPSTVANTLSGAANTFVTGIKVDSKKHVIGVNTVADSDYRNQNAFGFVSVNGEQIAAENVSDILEIISSNGVVLSKSENSQLEISLSNEIKDMDILISCGTF